VDTHLAGHCTHGLTCLKSKIAELEAESLGQILQWTVGEYDVWIQQKLEISLLALLDFDNIRRWFDWQRSQICVTSFTA
jgi:hypothetical protein